MVLPEIKISVLGVKMVGNPETPGINPDTPDLEHSGENCVKPGNSGYKPGYSGFGTFRGKLRE